MQAFNTPEYGGSIYNMFPKALKNPDFSPNPIIWNSTKYELVQTYYDRGPGKVEGRDYIEFTYFGGAKDRAPWVKLKDKATQQEFYVINTHDPINKPPVGALERYNNAKHYAEVLKNLGKEGLPIFLTGDFNSGYRTKLGGNNTLNNDRANLTYCVLTNNTGLWDAYDASKKKEGACPSTGVDWNDGLPDDKNASFADHIFMSTSASVTKLLRAPHGTLKNGSDRHDTIIADVSLSGEGDTGASGSFQWPITKEDYVPLNNCFAKPSGSADGHTGIDIPVKQKQVHASAAGTVAMTGGPSGDAGNYIVIDHGNGKWTNYQHLSKIGVTDKQKVNVGDVIGTSGNTGYVLGTTGYHLHFGVTNKLGLDKRDSVAYSLNPLDFLTNDRDLGVCK
jgi:murein DD-endopeptidase MepM/ murein hydrolase activator NlpD